MILRPSELGSGMLTITPELMAAAVLAENAHIDLDQAKKFVNGLTQEQIADLSKQGLDVDSSSYSQKYQDAIVGLYNNSHGDGVANSEQGSDSKSVETSGSISTTGGGGNLPPDDDQDNKGQTNQANKIKKDKLDNLPENVQDTYSKYEKGNWSGNFNGQTPGTNAGRTFKNSDNKLPTIDSNGNPISYREFDVNNKIVGKLEMLRGLLEVVTVLFITRIIITKHLYN